MKWETKNLRTQQNRKVNNKAKNKHIPRMQMRIGQYKGSGNMRLKCKKRQKTLVYVDGWTVKKSLLHEQKLQKTT